MIGILFSAALVLTTVGATTDTTLTVREGTRLEVSNYSGSVEVSTWNRDAVRIRAEHSRHTEISIDRSDDVLQVESESRMGPAGVVRYAIQVPSWMALKIEGVFSDVSIDGAGGEIGVETVQGEIAVRGGRDRVRLSAVQGPVRVEGVRGDLEASCVNDSVVVSDVSGDVRAESVNGPVTLERMRSRHVDASTVNGVVVYQGGLESHGEYSFSSHNGDLVVCVPDRPDASVRVSTVNGEFDSDFEVQTHGLSREKSMEFTLGTGSAALEMESFQGTMTLCRQGSERAGAALRQSASPHPASHTLQRERARLQELRLKQRLKLQLKRQLKEQLKQDRDSSDHDTDEQGD